MGKKMDLLQSQPLISSQATIEGRQAKRKRGRPPNDENVERRRQHQIQLLRKIQLRTGKSNAELENEFKVGPKSGGINGNKGKAWRRWVNGENVCRPAVLRTICTTAARRGWLDDDDLNEERELSDEGSLASLVAVSPDDWKSISAFRHRCEQAFQQLVIAIQNYERLLTTAQSDGHRIISIEKNAIARDGSELKVKSLCEKQLQAHFSEARNLIRELGLLSVSLPFLRKEQTLADRQVLLMHNALNK